MCKVLTLLQTCQNKQFWSLTYLFVTIRYVNSENLGLLGLPMSFLYSGRGNWWKAQIRLIHSWAPICQRFNISTFKYMFLKVRKSQEFVKISLLCNKSFKIQDGFQLWSMIVATKLVLYYQPFWNNHHWCKHAKTSIFKVLYNYLWESRMLTAKFEDS